MHVTAEPHRAKSLVIGATGLVGGYIVEHLRRAGEQPLALSRSPRNDPDAIWFQGDLARPVALDFPAFSTLYCTASADLLANALPHLGGSALNRVIAFSSTSIATKMNSQIAAEREAMQNLAAAEQQIIAICEQRSIAWTILRPTLIYDAGRDQNITPLSRLIRRFGFMPMVGGARGLRQPVHAEDLAIGAISAASSDCGCKQDLCAARGRNAELPGNDRPDFRWTCGGHGAPFPCQLFFGKQHLFSRSRCFLPPIQQWVPG